MRDLFFSTYCVFASIRRLSENMFDKQIIWEALWKNYAFKKVKWEAFPFQLIAHLPAWATLTLFGKRGRSTRLLSPSSTSSSSSSSWTFHIAAEFTVKQQALTFRFISFQKQLVLLFHINLNYILSMLQCIPDKNQSVIINLNYIL